MLALRCRATTRVGFPDSVGYLTPRVAWLLRKVLNDPIACARNLGFLRPSSYERKEVEPERTSVVEMRTS
jgi:hypothetical protein